MHCIHFQPQPQGKLFLKCLLFLTHSSSFSWMSTWFMLLHYNSGRLPMNTCGTSSKMLVELLQFEYCMISLLENHGSTLFFSPHIFFHLLSLYIYVTRNYCLLILLDDKFLVVTY